MRSGLHPDPNRYPGGFATPDRGTYLNLPRKHPIRGSVVSAGKSRGSSGATYPP
jgi:hypothetical protein